MLLQQGAGALDLIAALIPQVDVEVRLDGGVDRLLDCAVPMVPPML